MPIPQPYANEQQSEFVERCHAALAGERETDDANSICFSVWQSSRGVDDLERKAVQRFSANEFVRVRNVPQFAEHITHDREGNAVVYDRAALESITKRCNSRIADTNDFPPLTEGHTPDRDQMSKGHPMPDVLGYVGPFRLGKIGNETPRWAIFADEWHHREDVPKLHKLRRRSPELWLEERMEDRFMDPIAALGAETPRLDMGLNHYCRTASGRLVEKYTAVAPSATSTFVPSDEIKKKHQAQENESMALTPQDVQQIVDAIEQLDWVQYVKTQMQNGPVPTGGDDMAGAAGPEAGGMDVPGGDAPADAVGGDAAAPNPMAGAGGGEMAPAAEDPAKKMGAGMRYSADESAAGGLAGMKPAEGDVSDPSLMKFSRVARQQSTMQDKYARMETQYRAMKARLDKIEGDKRHAERYSKLLTLQQQGFEVDVDDEMERTKAYDPARFSDHLDTIQRYGRRIPVAGAVPSLFMDPELDRGATQQSEKYAKKRSDTAVRICQTERAKNNNITFEEALQLADKQLVSAS